MNALPKFAVEYGDRSQYFLRIENDNGDTDSIPYVQLGLIEGRSGPSRDSKKLILHFSIGIVEIIGENMDHLLTQLEAEMVRVLRRGLSENEDGPKIQSVRLIIKKDENRF
jgi:hypothetical protein